MRSERSQDARHVTTHGGSEGRYQAAQGAGDMTSALGPSRKDLVGRVAWRRASRTLDQAGCELDDRRVDTQIIGRSL